MQEVELVFRGFDAHELACHFVARQAGIYARHGLRVRLRDGIGTASESSGLPQFHAACGLALGDWLRGEPSRKVIFIAAQRPMFWLYGRPGPGGLAALAGGRVASYPDGAPPAAMLPLALDSAVPGLAPQLTLLPVRDDAARLGLLRAGDVDAAVLSSAMAPGWPARSGAPEVLFFGDWLRIPTTGLAIAPALLATEAARAMCRAWSDSLVLIHAGAQPLVQALEVALDFSNADSVDMAARVRAAYSCDGRSAPDVLQSGIDLMCGALKCQPPAPVTQLYDFSLLPVPEQK